MSESDTPTDSLNNAVTALEHIMNTHEGEEMVHTSVPSLKVDENGRVYLPKRVREQASIEEGDYIDIILSAETDGE